MKTIAIAAASMLALFAVPAAQAQLVTNGNFSSTYSTGSANPNTPSQLNLNGYALTGWTSAPSNNYTFIFNPSLAGAAAYTSNGQYNPIQLYTSANGGSASAPASLVSPTGGNFIASDPAFQSGTISQLITGLTVGATYQLSFYWAASQQAGFDGITTAGWTGTLGSTAFATQVVTNPNHGFTPWTKYTANIRATSASETLTFLAVGGPSGGQPPFALLDGVNLTAVPEPATWSLLMVGFGVVGYTLRLRQRTRKLTYAG